LELAEIFGQKGWKVVKMFKNSENKGCYGVSPTWHNSIYTAIMLKIKMQAREFLFLSCIECAGLIIFHVLNFLGRVWILDLSAF
jgi:hypothetical protein